MMNDLIASRIANGLLEREVARLSARRDELLAACKAVLDALERADLCGAVLWIEPPYQAVAVHESAQERLRAVIANGEITGAATAEK